MDYKSDDFIKKFTKSNILNDWRGSLHVQNGSISQNKNPKNNFKDVISFPDIFYSKLAEDLTSENPNIVKKELNNFYRISTKQNFSFSSAFVTHNLHNILYNLLQSDRSNLSILLKIFANITASGFSQVFLEVDLLETLVDIFQGCGNETLSNYALTSIVNLTGDLVEFRDLVFEYLPYFIELAQKPKTNKITKQSIFTLVMNLSLFDLADEQFNEVGNIVLSLLDYLDELSTKILTHTILLLTNHSRFYEFFKNTKVTQFLSTNLSSSDAVLLKSTLLIEEKIYHHLTFTEIPEIFKLSLLLSSKNGNIIISSCRVLTEIFGNSPDALNNEDGLIIAQILANLVIHESIKIKNEAFYCLICLIYIRNNLLLNIVNDDFVVRLCDFLDSDDDVLVIQTIIILDIIFSLEANRTCERPLFECFLNSNGMAIIDELHENQNLEIAEYSLVFNQKFF
ncbi:hypothetical protein TRFO_16210 [Tritrichomonas foetus]|uniref:Armadillo repeat-containing domain-containing protein n=1 Tax=Tritrichomonas foetus TaxID=1144522 RepID=A0A1J4KRY1_9EUKA|nr:hypothetical protein TRFO_16210 [Tritrichomonas foetus]|eukprot:OHT13648.1 hypothetical protein TRFO_16210 [Tritrichomonas foetus]